VGQCTIKACACIWCTLMFFMMQRVKA
jgi:hypothetical protein